MTIFLAKMREELQLLLLQQIISKKGTKNGKIRATKSGHFLLSLFTAVWKVNLNIV